jgi:V/A-type H+-transporting ATPase subunit I
MNISGDLGELMDVLRLAAADPLVHLEDAASVIHGLKAIGAQSGENPYRELLGGLEALAAAAGADPDAKTKNKEQEYAGEFDAPEVLELVKACGEKIKGKNDEINEAEMSVRDNRKITEQLDHVGDISADLDALFNFEFIKFRFGHMPREAYDSIEVYKVADTDDVFFIPSSIEKNEVWGLYFTPRTKSEKVDSMFSILHFERVRISDKAHGTPEHARCELTREIKSQTELISAKKAELSGIISEARGLVEDYYEKSRLLFDIYELKKKAAQTSAGFHLAVWLPESHVLEFSRELAKFSTVDSPVSSPSDMPYITPPTLLKNFFLFRPFEQFVTMYGLPQYNEADPTPFLALTYILFFGIMFGDLGQGLVISLAGFLIWKLKGVNLGRIACILGLSSAAFGCFFGSVFGLEDIILGYNPLGHINTVLICAVGLGAATVSGAAVLNIINGIKQKNIEKALFSQNGLAGLVFYWSVLTAGLAAMKFLPPVVSVSAVAALAVLCAVLIYLREPLANLLARKSKILPPNPAGFLVTGLFELFEIVLSFLTNTISFIRVGAFALNHVGMMSVVMLLARTASGGNNLAVVVMGNIVVIAVEGLIVGIQCLRLQYYEIFGRFFSGSGRMFASGAFDKFTAKKNKKKKKGSI